MLFGFCGKCCQTQEIEIEELRPVGKPASTAGFRGGIQVGSDQAPAVVESQAVKLNTERSEDYLDPVPPPSAPELTEPTSPRVLPAPLAVRSSSGLIRQITSTTPRTFNTTVVKGSRKMGIDINYHDNTTFLVTKVNAGPVMDHNSSNTSEQVLPGDRITELNGIRGSLPQMLAACRSSTDIQINVTTGVERMTHIDAGSAEQTLGITAKPCDMVSLVITKLEDGGLVKQRTGSHPELDLAVNDRIVGINDVRLDAAELLRELSRATSWNIAWRRVATGPT